VSFKTFAVNLRARLLQEFLKSQLATTRTTQNDRSADFGDFFFGNCSHLSRDAQCWVLILVYARVVKLRL